MGICGDDKRRVIALISLAEGEPAEIEGVFSDDQPRRVSPSVSVIKQLFRDNEDAANRKREMIPLQTFDGRPMKKDSRESSRSLSSASALHATLCKASLPQRFTPSVIQNAELVMVFYLIMVKQVQLTGNNIYGRYLFGLNKA